MLRNGMIATYRLLMDSRRRDATSSIDGSSASIGLRLSSPGSTAQPTDDDTERKYAKNHQRTTHTNRPKEKFQLHNRHVLDDKADLKRCI